MHLVFVCVRTHVCACTRACLRTHTQMNAHTNHPVPHSFVYVRTHHPISPTFFVPSQPDDTVCICPMCLYVPNMSYVFICP
jgi:hypothetical protein